MGAAMRGSDDQNGALFSYVNLEDRVPARHPLRVIRRLVNEVLAALDGEFAKLYAESGRPSIAPERLLRALLLQAFYTIRSERQLMEQLDYNLLYRWFVGLGVDEPGWVGPGLAHLFGFVPDLVILASGDPSPVLLSASRGFLRHRLLRYPHPLSVPM